jgi:hypothetical protein
MGKTGSERNRLEDLIRKLEDRLPDTSVEAIRGLMRCLFTRASPDLIHGRDVTSVVGEFAALLKLVDSTPSGAIATRVVWDRSLATA